MVVCPCGVMMPAGGGTGRIRRAVRTPSCFHSGETVTSQPKDLQEPASVEKLTAATNNDNNTNNTNTATTTTTNTAIQRLTTPAVHTKNKGGGGRLLQEEGGGSGGKGVVDPSSRTTLALATRESGRYVGTRPLKSNNKSPTPTLTTTCTNKGTLDTNKQTTVVGPAGSSSSSRGSKHLPAVRTSNTTITTPATVVVSPQDNNNKQAATTPTAPPTARLKAPVALPRKVPAVTQRINELNVANQKSEGYGHRNPTTLITPKEEYLQKTSTPEAAPYILTI